MKKGTVIELTEFEYSFDKKHWKPIIKSREFGNPYQPIYIRKRDKGEFEVLGRMFKMIVLETSL